MLKEALIKGAAIDYAARKSVTERGDNRFNQHFLKAVDEISDIFSNIMTAVEEINNSGIEITNDDVSESESVGTLGSDENECIILNEESDNDDAKRLIDTITIEADEDELIWE